MFIRTELLQPLSIQSFILFIHAELSPFNSFRVVSPLSMKSCLPFIHTQLLHSWSIRSCHLLYICNFARPLFIQSCPGLYPCRVVSCYLYEFGSPLSIQSCIPFIHTELSHPLSIQSGFTPYLCKVVKPWCSRFSRVQSGFLNLIKVCIVFNKSLYFAFLRAFDIRLQYSHQSPVFYCYISTI